MTPPRPLKTIRRFVQIACLGFAAICNVLNANAGFTFTSGHIYSTWTFGNTTNVTEYTAEGTVLGSLTIPSLLQDDELRGIAFGPDGLLYALMVHFADSGFQVLALDSSGTVHQTYRMEGVYVWGNGASGKIALDQQYIYAGGGDDLVRFTMGDPTSGVSIYTNNQVFDVNILPSGHLFVASAYQVDEITNTGGFVRTVVSSNGTDFVDIWGIEYNPATNKLFVSQLGTTGSKYSILRVNASTGEIETGALFNYANDLFLTGSGNLAVGSWTETARIYNQELIFVGQLGTDQRQFVTQYSAGGPTPTPTPTQSSPRAAVVDFNGDGHPDWVVRNAGTRQTGIWYMINNVFMHGGYGPTLAAGWGLRSVADFNRDTHSDYALFNPVMNRTAIWYLNNNVLINGAYGPTLPAGWELVATADLNGDNKPDCVLYRASTRQTAIWYLNNNVFVGGAYGPTLPAGWELVATADFNGGGKPDYVLYKPTTRQTAIWYLNNIVFAGSAWGPTLPAGWSLVATADFNGGGKPDYVLYNPSTRQTAIWYLNNNIFLAGAYGPTLPAGWSLVAP